MRKRYEMSGNGEVGEACEPLIHPMNRDHVNRFEIDIVVCHAGDPAYEDVLRVRSAVYKVPAEHARYKVDAYSDMFCAYIRGLPVGSLRVTRAASGLLDCEEFFPSVFLKMNRRRICSASRFCVAPQVEPLARVPKLLVEAAWIYELRHDVRIDVIDVHERGVAYYERLGYRLVEDVQFVHPHWHTPSRIMVFPAHPQVCSPIRHVFEHVTDGVTFAELEACLRLRPQRGKRLAS